MTLIKNTAWLLLAAFGALVIGGIAMHRGETINALWLVTAALCVYIIAYRFYAAWIAAKLLVIDPTRATPAERFNNGQDYIPTNKWVVFGHHFAAIAGPGPLVGPTLAAQFGYLPGTLWILCGAVLGGCAQDMVILFLSMRRNARSLGQMARDELGVIGGTACLIATFAIMMILIAVLGLVVVNAMKHSVWATATVAATIPIAMLVGLYMHIIRPGQVLEASCIGVALLLLAVVGGKWISEQPGLMIYFDHGGLILAAAIIIYGLCAAVLPVWLLLAPRDYLSTFVKLGTIVLLALAIFLLKPVIQMPALTQYIDGTGPIFGGKLFPFVFITIACGAISGFHSLIASGTTPKLISNERDVRMIGYGSMLLESFVALMALVAATVMDPDIYFAINTPAALAKYTPHVIEQMHYLAQEMGEATLFARTGGAPSFAVGMASIFSKVFGEGMLALWYHFAIMFEALFILTTLDAGTRVGRFMLQDMLGNIWPKIGRTSWMPSVILCSSLVVACWGYFLYIGVIDPNGGVNILWPMFGIANQMLAAIALSVATGILFKSKRLRYLGVTALPLLWLLIITTTAAWEKITSDDLRIGFIAAANDISQKLSAGVLPEAQVKTASQLIFNLHLDAWLTLFFVVMVWVIVLDMLRQCWLFKRGRKVVSSSESNYLPTQLEGY